MHYITPAILFSHENELGVYLDLMKLTCTISSLLFKDEPIENTLVEKFDMIFHLPIDNKSR